MTGEAPIGVETDAQNTFDEHPTRETTPSTFLPVNLELARKVVSSADWKVEHRVLSLVKMGFKRQEAEAALSASPSGEVMGHDTLTRLLEPFRPSGSGAGAGSKESSLSTRAEEVIMPSR